MNGKTKKQVLDEAQPTRPLPPFEEMDRMFDEFRRRGWMRPWRLEWPSFGESGIPEMKLPKIDVIDRESEVLVKAEVPGVDKKDIDISVGEDVVTIKG
jgi:HSP20 family protein